MDMRVIKLPHGAAASGPSRVGDKDPHVGATCSRCKAEQRLRYDGFSRPELELLSWLLATLPSDCCGAAVTTELRNVP